MHALTSIPSPALTGIPRIQFLLPGDGESGGYRSGFPQLSARSSRGRDNSPTSGGEHIRAQQKALATTVKQQKRGQASLT